MNPVRFVLQDQVIPSWNDNQDIIEGLKRDYEGPCEYYEDGLVAIHAGHIENRLFIGSLGQISITSDAWMSHDAPGCLAAPNIQLAAKHFISLGTNSPSLLRLFAPTSLVITTKHLLVGRVDILKKPSFGLISCKKLTLFRELQHTASYELLQSMLMDDVDLEFINIIDKTEGIADR